MSTSVNANEATRCILCDSNATTLFHSDKRRDYLKCSDCQLVFVPPHQHISHDDEKAEYDKHENSVTDLGYLKFLSRVGKPLLNKLGYADKANLFGSETICNEPEASTEYTDLSGLDFGCGPGPALATELNRLGLKTELYDIYYHPDESKLEVKYDFVTCTEVVEHFNQPSVSIPLLLKLVKRDGLAAIMTKLVIDQERFANWHYKNDQTHVAFYSTKTFEWIAKRFDFSVEFVDKDVIFLHKQ